MGTVHRVRPTPSGTRHSQSRFRSRFVALVVGVLTLLPAAAFAIVDTSPIASDSPDNPIGPSGRVYDIATFGDLIYIAGNFTSVDGNGQPYLAAIDRNTGQVDATWAPTLNNSVEAIEVAPDGSVVYIGGSFTNVNGVQRRRIAALDPITGAPTSWNPDASAKVRAIAATDTMVFVGGNFANIGGQPSQFFGAIDAASGALASGWSIESDGKVLALEVTSDLTTLFVGGNYDQLGAATVSHLAAIDVATASVLPFSTDAPHKILDLTLSDDDLVLLSAGGGPLSNGGNLAAAHSATSGGSALWTHQGDGDMQAVAVEGDVVYVGGHFNIIDGVPSNRLAAFNRDTGAQLTWNPGADSGLGVWSLLYSQDRLLVGGDFATIGGVTQPHFGMFLETGNAMPVASFTEGCSGLTCQFDASASADGDGTVESYAWDFGDGGTAFGLAPAYAFASAGTYAVELTVTDDDGATDVTSHDVTVTVGSGAISYVGSASVDINADEVTVTVPTGVGPYDGLLLFTSANQSTVTLTAPPGWTLLDTVIDSTMQTTVWSRVAGIGEAGSPVTVSSSGQAKLNAIVLAYDGTDVDNPVELFAGEGSPVNSTDHTTPLVTTTIDGDWIVSYWANKTGSTTSWTPPGGEVVRAELYGTGGGHISAIATDTGSGAVPGSYGAKTASADDGGTKATTWTVALQPDAGLANVSPTASFVFACSSLSCDFDAGASVDPDGSIIAYDWDFGDGATDTGVTPTHVYAGAGTFAVTLTVTDNGSATGVSNRDATVPNNAPTASYTFGCTDLSCSFDASGSTDADGTIVAYDWDFGDGATDSGGTTSHNFGGGGTFPVTLRVTDEDGSSDTFIDSVVVVPPNEAPTASFTWSCTDLDCSFDAAASADSDGTIVSYDWDFGDGATDTGVTANHSYTTGGGYTVTLTVTDDDSAIGVDSQGLFVSEPGATPITFRAAATEASNATNHTLTVPATVVAGDGLLLFASVNKGPVTIDDPTGVTGWVEVATAADNTLTTKVWKKVADGGDAGQDLTVTLGGSAKTDLVLVAYSGTDPVDPVHAFAAATETATTASHQTPLLTTTTDGTLLVSYWSEKSSTTTVITPPPGVVTRHSSTGVGGGRVTTLLIDGGVQEPAGSYGGLIGTADSAAGKATMWTIALAPAP